MSWTKEPPTTPGLYAWCDGKRGEVFTFTLLRDGNVVCHDGVFGENWTPRRTMRSGGLWQPLTIQLPAPYTPPKPPVVEVYSAKFLDESRWLVRIGDMCIALDPDDNNSQCGEESWNGASKAYTGIEKVQ